MEGLPDMPWEEMRAAAKEAQARAYAPYSKLRIGAALWTGRQVHAGCNIENASFGLTVCAERNALARVAVAGERPLALVIFAQVERPLVPCGACRQVLAEFCAPDLCIVSYTGSGEREVFQLGALLPVAFALPGGG